MKRPTAKTHGSKWLKHDKIRTKHSVVPRDYPAIQASVYPSTLILHDRCWCLFIITVNSLAVICSKTLLIKRSVCFSSPAKHIGLMRWSSCEVRDQDSTLGPWVLLYISTSCLLVGGFNLSEKYESIGMMTFSIYGKITVIFQENHQPEGISPYYHHMITILSPLIITIPVLIQKHLQKKSPTSPRTNHPRRGTFSVSKSTRPKRSQRNRLFIHGLRVRWRNTRNPSDEPIFNKGSIYIYICIYTYIYIYIYV